MSFFQIYDKPDDVGSRNSDGHVRHSTRLRHFVLVCRSNDLKYDLSEDGGGFGRSDGFRWTFRRQQGVTI